jgi:transcription elongation factor GreA
VQLADEDTDEKVKYQIVGPYEADLAKRRISVTSPIGRALIGKEPGDAVKVATPGGTREFEITKLITIHDEAVG